MYCKDIEREIEMKKVILSLAIAGLGTSGSCYGVMKTARIVEESSTTILSSKQDVAKFKAESQSRVLADVSEVSALDYIKLRIKVRRPVYQRKLKTAAIVGALAAAGIGVGVVAYYTSPSFHGLVDGVISFPGLAVDYVKSRPEALVSYLNGAENPVVSMGWKAIKYTYSAVEYGCNTLESLTRPVRSLHNILVME